ncbi:hypothetical protein RJ639_003027 [Escallonia herrerae]|uniref:Aspergillus nuclease S1 n=1 Tax=Escallonia herrerae TaxID=1293975 RepID=A0AA89AXZ4_9ASTE|nr:hypothetical protein RJ639_003027 [Escallonia herrerae]
MESLRVYALALASFLFLLPVVHSWGVDGHLTICRIAQARLSAAAADAVKNLLPESAENDLGSVCSWADHVKFHYRWSPPLHYIDTPDNLCTYQYDRDCKDENGVKDRCVAGAINNYTSQLLSHGYSASRYNLTEALLFLSHFMGDIHQPLHVGFTLDKGGNTIDVHWYTRKSVLHHVYSALMSSIQVWDDNIIETADERFYDSNVDGLIDTLQKNITNEWADQVQKWENCGGNKPTCPDMYVLFAKTNTVYKKLCQTDFGDTQTTEAVNSCRYKSGMLNNCFADDYFLSRLPIVNLRLAQGGVRLAATLNRIFG